MFIIYIVIWILLSTTSLRTIRTNDPNDNTITVYIILICWVFIIYLLNTLNLLLHCLAYCYPSSAYIDHVLYSELTFENTYFMGNWYVSRTGSDHRKTTHTKQTHPRYTRTNIHALTGKRTNWRPKTMPSSFHILIAKNVQSLLFLSGERPTHTPTQNKKQFICVTSHTVQWKLRVLLLVLEREVRKEKGRVIPSDQLEKLLLITSERELPEHVRRSHPVCNYMNQLYGHNIRVN
jgi:hypothetical protein